jgi:hypothetical protein
LQVDQNRGIVDQQGLPQGLKLSFSFYGVKMTESADKENRNHNDKKLTKVLSVKVSIEDTWEDLLFATTPGC